MDQVWIPVHREWRLNERHYGALQGLNKAETAEKHGDDQVLVWRRSYDIPPPPMTKEDEGYAGKDRRYSNLSEENIPLTECLKDTVARFLPLWEGTIAPQIKSGKQVLIAAHGNSLRALIKYLDGVSEEEIIGMNVPTGMPLVYDLDESLKPTNRQYLGDPEKVAKAMEAVANQGKQNRNFSQVCSSVTSDYFIQMDTSSDKPKKLKREYDENFAVTGIPQITFDIQNSGSAGMEGAHVPILQVGISGFRLLCNLSVRTASP